VSGFSAEWLALREPLDRRARNPDVLDAVAEAFAGRPSLSVVDLGSGTGSTVRALSRRLPRRQQWTLVDNDPVLLAEAYAMERPADVAIETMQIDLADDIAPLFNETTELVTASALLDLVSEPWLATFAAAVAARALPVYIALSYDGRIALEASDPVDLQVAASVNAHQRRNKGFGPALGPRAAAFAVQIFQSFGYSVVQGPSDWIAGAGDAAFQSELLAGWRQAACDMGDLPQPTLDGWFARRSEAVAAGRLALTVGHTDFFARPKNAKERCSVSA
jgi:SAM-dependent methyltransferase